MFQRLLGVSFALAACAASNSAAAEIAPAARQAASVVSKFHDALRNGRPDVAARLLDSDALVFESGGVEHDKAEYAAHHLPVDAAFARQVARSVTRQSGEASGDMAWIATESRTSGSYQGKPVNRAGTETMVLRRVGQSWKISHIHWSSGK